MSPAQPSYGSGATLEKLDAGQRYADGFTTALKNQPEPDDLFVLHYVDAFAGRGEVSLRAGMDTGDIVPGSALRALEVTDRPFDRLLFIEKNEQNYEELKRVVAARDKSNRATVVHGDANQELPKFCEWLGSLKGRMHRAFVFIDPYAMQMDWTTVVSIANTGRADLLMLFPLMSVRRQLKRDGWPVTEHRIALNRFYGDESWQGLYTVEGGRAIREGGDREIVESYVRRLQEIFVEVVDPKRTLGSADDGSLFTLLFGSSNRRGARVAVPIAEGVFKAATGTQGRLRL